MKRVFPFRSVSILLLVFLLIVGTLPASVFAASSAEIKQELNGLKDQNREIQAEIDAVQVQYDANADEIQALVDRKNAVDQEIALLHEQIININEQVRVYGQLAADTQEELEEAETALTELNQKHKERIRAMEEQGTLSYWQVIFDANSFTDLLDRLEMVDEIAAADQKRLEEIRIAADSVQTAQTALSEELAGLEESQQQLQQSEAELTNKRTESDDILRQLVEKQAEFQSLLDESEARQDALMKQIAAKQRELKNAEYREELERMARKGQNPPSDAVWIVPVSDYHISSAFGMRVHPVYGYQLMHNGVDMACAQGTPIYATRAGTVTTAAYQAGGAGYYVSLNHGDGFGSVYMHMTRYVVSAGQSVSQGQLIGYVGNTGVSTGPHLHFGVSYGGTYVNPMAYI